MTREDEILAAARKLVSAVERYVAPMPGEHCLRSELLNTKDNLKHLINEA